MIILGINAHEPVSSACILKDGEILYAVPEERLTRIKKTRAFPVNAIKFCLEKANVDLRDVDIISVPVNAGIYLEHFNGSQSSHIRYRGEYWYSVLNNVMSLIPDKAPIQEAMQSLVFEDGHNLKVQFVEHHLAHAAIAFHPSGFEESAILSIDGFGEKDCVFAGTGKNGTITPLFKQEFPHSVGCFYETITEFLGFRPKNDEWKVMGASSYGNPDVFYDKLLSLFTFKEPGIELDLSYFNYYMFHRPMHYTEKLVQLLGKPRTPQEAIEERHFNIAAAAQKVSETLVFHLAENIYKMNGLKNLCFSGGVAMNSVCNGKILENTSFENIYVPSAPDDGGGSIGSALYAYYIQNDEPRYPMVTTNYYGPSYTDKEILEEINKFGLAYETSDDPASDAAKLIAKGSIVGWMQGSIEFGDRALGNRSILADPRNAEMKDVVNIKVKFREEFRPFAPSILEEYMDEYFIDAKSTPFMEKVYVIREEKRKDIPAVVHVDGTGRLQTVNKNDNQLYYSLIKHFQTITGVPVVLNTSFNLKGEPIVCSPKDAVRTFFSCGMDVLFLGNHIIRKS